MGELNKRMVESADATLAELLANVSEAVFEVIGDVPVSNEEVYKLLAGKRTESIRKRVIRAMVKQAEYDLLEQYNKA